VVRLHLSLFVTGVALMASGCGSAAEVADTGSEAQSVSTQINLLTNNTGFESGGPNKGWGQATGEVFKFQGWEAFKHPGAFNRSQGVTGDAAAGSHGFSAGSAGWLATAADSRASVFARRVYELRYRAKKTVQRSGGLGIVARIVFYDSAGSEVGRGWGPRVARGRGDYAEYRFQVVAPANAARAGAFFDFQYRATGEFDSNPADEFALDEVSLVEVTQTDSIGLRRAPAFVEPGRASSVAVKYRAAASRDVLLRLTNRQSSLGEVRTSVPAGRGVVDLRFDVPATAVASNAYAWEFRLVAPGARWDSPLVSNRMTGVFLDQTESGGSTIAPNNPNLVYEGRWRTSDASNYRAIWQGSSVSVRFSGTSLRMRYGYTSWSVDHRLKLRVSLDGRDGQSVVLGQSGDATATIASGLSEGVHTATIVREGDELVGDWQLKGLVLDANRGVLRHAPFMNRRIEFYGDSTMGGEEGGMYVNYTKATARALGANSTVINKGATGVSGGFLFKYNALHYWDRLTWNPFYDSNPSTGNGGAWPVRNPYGASPEVDPSQSRSEAWGPGNFPAYGDPNSFAAIGNRGRFAEWVPDVVVLGYGQNDQFGGGPFESNYRQLIRLIKKVYPNAHIVLSHTNMTGPDALDGVYDSIRTDTGPGGLNADGRLHTLSVRGGPSAPGHPSAQQHLELATGNRDWRGLADFIEESVGWSTSGSSSGGGDPKGPPGYTFIANEGQSSTFTQVVDVAYGANDTFAYRNGVTGTVTFNNTTFGDPIPGVAKHGFYRAASLAFGNSSFETPAQAANGFAYRPANAAWRFSGNAGVARNGSPWGANAPDSQQFAFLQGNGDTGKISQAVDFAVGTWRLRFKIAQRWGQTQPVKVTMDGYGLGTFAPSTGAFEEVVTGSITLNTAGVRTILIEATDASGDKTSIIDAVRLERSP
jgi:hypothetical protein